MSAGYVLVARGDRFRSNWSTRPIRGAVDWENDYRPIGCGLNIKRFLSRPQLSLINVS